MPENISKSSSMDTGKQIHSIFLICYLAALGAFGSFVNDLYLPTLPQMRIDFHASRSVVQLGLSFVMIGLGLGELVWGPWSDKIGRKPILYMSMTLFVLSSTISIFPPTITFFIVCRLFQGLGASGAVLLSRTIPADICQGMRLAKIMAMVGAINGIAPVAGPLAGGFMASAIGWRGIFTVLTGIGIAMLILGFFLHESLPPAKRKNLPLTKLLGEYGVLLHNKAFMTHVLLKSAALGALFCYISAGPFIIQEHYGFSALQFGLFFGCNAIAVVLGSIICVKFPTMKKAAVVGAAGMVFFTIAEAIAIYFVDSMWLFESLIVPMLFFSGLVFSSANTLAMSEGSLAAGSASAILGFGGYVFGSVVSPLVGMGDILSSTSIAMTVCALICLYFAWQSFKMPALKVQP